MTDTASESRLFLAELTLPVHRIMVRAVVDCAARVAELLSLSQAEANGLQLAVEEAFCNAVDHFSGDVPEDERIHIGFQVEGDRLVVSVREKGIPFDSRQGERYTADSLEGMDRPGLGMLLMAGGMDSVDLFVHGREGKETRMTKRLPFGSLPPELLAAGARRRGRDRIPVRNVAFRPTRREELPEVCRLAWRCYGYTQESFLYDLDLLTSKFDHGEIKSILILDADRNQVIGHAGLKYHDPEVKVSEMGQAFLDPAYRCPGGTLAMAEAAREMARNNGDLGVFDCSVTTHTHSQKAVQEDFGSSPCSMLMGIAAAGMRPKELATANQEKGTTLNHYFPFDRSPAIVHIPERHREMVREIYQWMDMPRIFGEPATGFGGGESAVGVYPLPDELNVAFIVIHALGRDVVEKVAEGLRQCRRERRDAAYIFLPTSDPSAPLLVDACEELGCSFAGVMPHIHGGGDRMLLQRVDIPLDLDAVKVYGDRGRKLFSYIRRGLES